MTDTLAGTGLADNLAAGGQYFAIFSDGHNRQLPRLVGGPFRYKTYAADTLARSIEFATKPMKQAVIAPSMLALLYPLDEELPGYTREQFEEDLVGECEKDIRGAFDAGAACVSIDFTEGRLALREDSRNPWTGRGMLPHFIDLINRVLARFTAEERVNIGIHTCPGGDRDAVHSADVPYSALLPSLFQLNAGFFLMQNKSERDREEVYKLVGEHSREDADGVAQIVHIGVINPQNPQGRDRRRKSATSSSRRRSTSRRSASAQPTTAASRRSASTRSRCTARPISPATSRSRRSQVACRARRWRRRSSASTFRGRVAQAVSKSTRPRALSISQAAVISPMWLNACGKLPSSFPRAVSISSASKSRSLA